MSRHVDRNGQLLVDRYRLGEPLGRGGFGSVYMAVDTQLNDRKVAIKMLHHETAAHGQLVERFRREAQVLVSLNHPNVVTVHDAGETAQGELYLVMEHLEGLDLRTSLRREGRLSVERALKITLQVAEALEAVHRRGVVHRDVKPANIMLLGGDSAHRDFVKLLDFGIAKNLVSTDVALTEAGTTAGTPQYMSPEQLAGDPVTSESDLFVLAVVIYEMITGQNPFLRSTLRETQVSILSEAPPGLSVANSEVTVSAEFEALLFKGLCKEPEERGESVLEFVRGLVEAHHRTRALGEQNTLAEMASPSKPQDARWVLWALMGFGVIMALLAIAPIRHSEAPAPAPSESVSCESPLLALGAAVNELADSLRTQRGKRSAELAGHGRLASQIAGASALLERTGRRHCAENTLTLSDDWVERTFRIRLAIGSVRALLAASPTGADDGDLVGAVEIIVASADPGRELAPLKVSEVVTTRGGDAPTVALTRRCLKDGSEVACPEILAAGQSYQVYATLERESYLYGFIYDDAALFSVRRPIAVGAAPLPAGEHPVAARGGFTAHPGQVIGVVASPQRVPELDALVGQLWTPSDGQIHPAVRQVLAQLALARLTDSAPAQARLRIP